MKAFALAGFSVAVLLITAGAAWFSPGAGLITAGVSVAAFTVLLFVDVGGGDR